MEPKRVGSKRGTYMIEAAVVLPIIILTVITIILIVMFFYDGSVSQSDMHRALRIEADAASGKTTCYSSGAGYGGPGSGSSYGGPGSVGSYGSDGNALTEGVYFKHARKKISASKDISMIHEGLLRQSGSMSIRSSVYITDGTKYVLRRQKLGEIIKE